HYMLAFDDARVVAGATRATRSGFNYRTTVEGGEEVVTEAAAVATGLAKGSIEGARIGVRARGPDALPVIGKVDHLNGVTLATGLGASGLTMGPYVGRLAATIIKGEEVNLDLDAYHPGRAITYKDKLL